MKARYKKKPDDFKAIAGKRIELLFEQAAMMFKTNPELSDRYVFLARKLSMRYKIRIPPALKRQYCKHCHSFLVPSVNARVRLQNQKVVYLCMNCKKFMRFPYGLERKQKQPK